MQSAGPLQWAIGNAVGNASGGDQLRLAVHVVGGGMQEDRQEKSGMPVWDEMSIGAMGGLRLEVTSACLACAHNLSDEQII